MKLKNRINDGMARRDRNFRRRKDFYRRVYLNNGIRKDALSFNLIAEESVDRGSSFYDVFARLLQKSFATLFYLLYLLPFFSLYFLISSSGILFQQLMKMVAGSIKKANRAIDEGSTNHEGPLIYNP